MLNLLLGRVLARWLEKQADEPPQPSKPATVDLTETPVLDGDDPLQPRSDGEEFAYPRVQREAMGSLFEIYLAGRNRDALVGAANDALDEIERLDRQLSHYREESDISRLNAHASNQWVRLEPRLYRLLKRCAELSAQTGGAFDITTGSLSKAWGFYRGEGRLPSDAEIAEVLARAGMGRILFDDEDDLVYYTAPGMEVELGAIGKGYAIDEAAERLRFYGVKSAVIHGGQSTIYALGSPPDEDAWELTIKDPRDHETPIETVRLRNEALSTSGSYEQFFEQDGVRYSHILDPRTGRPTSGVLSVSVIAPNAADSDALSTAFFVMGREATEDFCRRHGNLRVVIMTESKEGELAVFRIGFGS